MKIHFVLLAVGIATFQLINAEFQLDSISSLVEESGEIGKCGKSEFYSVAHSCCLECGKCGSNMYENTKCHRDIDTVCDWCLSDNPVRNDDYFHKCSYVQVFGKFREELKSEMRAIRNESSPASIRSSLILYALAFMGLATLVLLGFWMCRMQRTYTRVINVTPPQLSEIDDHNIIFAANHLREKAVNKRGGGVPYEYL